MEIKLENYKEVFCEFDFPTEEDFWAAIKNRHGLFQVDFNTEVYWRDTALYATEDLQYLIWHGGTIWGLYKRKKIKKKKKSKKFRDRLNKLNEKADLDFVFTFGKHKGNTCRYVCRVDPEYILWCVRTKVLQFTKEVIELMAKTIRKNKAEQQRRDEEEQKRREEELKRQERERQERRKRADDWFNSHSQYSTYNQNFSDGFGDAFGALNKETRQTVSPAAQWDHLPAKQKHGKILGITGGKISKSEIRKLYKKRLLEYHPDKVADRGKLIQDLSHEMTSRIHDAYKWFKQCYGV